MAPLSRLSAITVFLLASCIFAVAQIQPACASRDKDAAPCVDKIDPPNWWVNMPKPMLLIRGERLDGAKFTVSDSHLKIERVEVSANGHWAELWLSASPAAAENISIQVDRNGRHLIIPFTFAQRRASTDGFAGFSSKDVMYLLMTDRFADGNTANDDSAAEQAKPRGWHGGDLRGIREHLDYLQELGITTVWITPVYQNKGPESYHGYGATDMYAVDKHFGNLDDLKSLAASLHRRGMKLVLDMVPNHVGPISTRGSMTHPSPTGFTVRRRITLRRKESSSRL